MVNDSLDKCGVYFGTSGGQVTHQVMRTTSSD